MTYRFCYGVAFMLNLAVLAWGATASTDTAKRSIAESAFGQPIIQAEQLRRRGQLHEAETAFAQLLVKARQHQASKVETLVSTLLAELYIQQYRYAEAKSLLQPADQAARQNQWLDLQALIANNQGNLHYYAGEYAAADQAYQQSIDLAISLQDHALFAQAGLNLARLDVARGRLAQALDSLKKTEKLLVGVASPAERLRLRLQAGKTLIDPKLSQISATTELVSLAYRLLDKAWQQAVALDDVRAQSSALGYLGQLYETQQRTADALVYAEQAVMLAQQSDASDLLVQWEWLKGRIYIEQQKPQPALQAFRNAVAHIQAIRQDIPVTFRQGRSSFRSNLEPVYLGLADVLLQSADGQNESVRQHMLKEARSTVELLKQSEMEDYFKSRCELYDFKDVSLEKIAPRTATLYPILLPDRMELLLGVGDQLWHFSVPVSADRVSAQARQLAGRLRVRRGHFHAPANQLYQWIIAPLEKQLAEHHIDTLVIVPDRGLRQVPFAVLSDGNDYLVSRYAVVTSAGLQLFDPRPTPRNKIDVLLAGISRPGDVVKALPKEYIRRMVSVIATQTGIQPEIVRGVNNQQNQVEEYSDAEIEALLASPKIIKHMQQALSLPGVQEEITALSSMLPSTVMMNEQFRSEHLHSALQNLPYRVVHIASHGYFGSSSQQSYLMTYDRVVTIDQLESLFHTQGVTDQPIELLTLSACQTAEGDDSSPLGLSGVALRAKVRSVMGALWPVSDAATVKLMEVFYQQLKSPGISKAAALQRAQLTLLNDGKHAHPFYWAPFILIGNWL